MAKNQACDPLFGKVLESLSKDAKRNLTNSGLLDLGVLVCYVDGLDTEIEELAREPGDVVKLQELLRHSRRAARGQRAECARRRLDEFVRRDKERREEARTHETEGPTDLQRAAEAPPLWHSRRLPSRLARSAKLQGDTKAREKAEEDERQRWASHYLVWDSHGGPRSQDCRPQAVSGAYVRQSPCRDGAQLRACVETAVDVVDRDRQQRSAVRSRSAGVSGAARKRTLCTLSVLRRTRAALAF